MPILIDSDGKAYRIPAEDLAKYEINKDDIKNVKNEYGEEIDPKTLVKSVAYQWYGGD